MKGYQSFITQLAEISYDPFFVIDRERRIKQYNHPFESLMDLSAARRRSIAGTSFDELLKLDATGMRCIRDCMETDSNVRVHSVKATLPDGREVVLDMSAQPLHDERRHLVAVLVLHRDVTDEQRLKERHDRMRKEHLAERDSLLRIISDRDTEIRKLKSR